MTASSSRGLLWFRNDLRLHDNVIVSEAMKRVKSGLISEVLPVYVFDPRFISDLTTWGTPKLGAYRAVFLVQSVLDLKQNLKSIGSDLLIRVGLPEKELPKLVHNSNTSVFTQAEVTDEETKVDKAVEKGLPDGSNLEVLWGSTLYHRDDLPFSNEVADMPDVFTPFRHKVEDICSVRKPVASPIKGALPLPSSSISMGKAPRSVSELNEMLAEINQKAAVLETVPAADSRAAFNFKGGETEALNRLKYYLWESDCIATYFETRNGMIGGDFSTKFGPWLSLGCLSPRTVYAEVKAYEKERVANKSTYWVIFELLCRDYFKFFALKHGNRIFHSGGIIRSEKSWDHNNELLMRWKKGKTGLPLVDANMRELLMTGWMSNRGRQNVASYFSLDLGLDWRLGGDWFETMLLDYDCASNWGNWVAAAGLTGGRVNKFNITKQSKDYDPEGTYIKLWCPELRDVPLSKIHEPWLMSKQEQEQAGCSIGKDYPAPIPVKDRIPGKSASRDLGTFSGLDRKKTDKKNKQRRSRSEYDMYG